VNSSASKVLFAVMVVWALSQTACAPVPDHRTGASPKATTAQQHLSPNEAAQLAARLANEECERRFHRRPFVAGQYPAVLRDGAYRWGGLDVAGPGGFSASVTFQRDGGKPRVEIYYSSDER
jgi:hypothetical protein